MRVYTMHGAMYYAAMYCSFVEPHGIYDAWLWVPGGERSHGHRPEAISIFHVVFTILHVASVMSRKHSLMQGYLFHCWQTAPAVSMGHTPLEVNQVSWGWVCIHSHIHSVVGPEVHGMWPQGLWHKPVCVTMSFFA